MPGESAFAYLGALGTPATAATQATGASGLSQIGQHILSLFWAGDEATAGRLYNEQYPWLSEADKRAIREARK